jgi:hypothetical protein
MRRIEDIAASHARAREVVMHPPSSPGVSSASSLSASSAASTSTDSVVAKWRGTRAVERDDPFYVGPSGAIHHSGSKAFEDVSSGPVRVVMGWEEAIRVAREVVSTKRPEDGKGKGKSKEVKSARRMEMD